MKRSLVAMAVIVLAMLAVRVYAAEPTALKMVKPDWHYRWHEARWWYWLPESSQWMVWNGSTWVTHEQFSRCPGAQSVSRARPESAADANLQPQSESGATGWAYPSRGHWGSGYSSGAGSGYSGYGWSWGPGTAFRDSPGRRF